MLARPPYLFRFRQRFARLRLARKRFIGTKLYIIRKWKNPRPRFRKGVFRITLTRRRSRKILPRRRIRVKGKRGWKYWKLPSSALRRKIGPRKYYRPRGRFSRGRQAFLRKKSFYAYLRRKLVAKARRRKRRLYRQSRKSKLNSRREYSSLGKRKAFALLRYFLRRPRRSLYRRGNQILFYSAWRYGQETLGTKMNARRRRTVIPCYNHFLPYQDLQAALGHHKDRGRSSAMYSYILLQRSDIHILDLTSFIYNLRRALSSFFHYSSRRKTMVVLAGPMLKVSSAFLVSVEKWLPGLITNFRRQVKSYLLLKRDKLQRSLVSRGHIQRSQGFSMCRMDRRLSRRARQRKIVLPKSSFSLKDKSVWVYECHAQAVRQASLVDATSLPHRLSYALPGNQESPVFGTFMLKKIKECVFSARLQQFFRFRNPYQLPVKKIEPGKKEESPEGFIFNA